MWSIPDSEFKQRIGRFQANIRAAGLDAALVHGNEADFANVRFLSEYWPTFEAAGVFVPADGTPVLIIGPESVTYAQGRSKIPRSRRWSSTANPPSRSIRGFPSPPSGMLSLRPCPADAA